MSERDARVAVVVPCFNHAQYLPVAIESALRQDLEEAVARDATAKVGEPLYADTLGPSGTYLGALRHDAAAMARRSRARSP